VRRRPRLVPLLAVAIAVSILPATAAFTSAGRFWTAYVFVFLDVYIGVVTLVALSLTVMAGLMSTDRVLLRIGHRVLLQGIHRATAVIALVTLGVHVAVKVLEAHAAIGDAFVPFFSQGRSLFIGFGTISAYLLVLAFWSGMARARFIGRVRPWVWRLLHSCAYLSWPVALLHGLNAGRQAATWVIVSYLGCLVLVGLGLLVRVYSKFGGLAAEAPRPATAVGVNVQTAIMPRIPAAPPAAVTTTGSPAGGEDRRDAGYRDAEPRRDRRDAGYRDEEPRRPRRDAGYRDEEPRRDRRDAGYRDEELRDATGARPHLRLVGADRDDARHRAGRRRAMPDDEPGYDESRAYRPAPTSDGWAPR
jgi:hypothetical protein